MENNIPKTVTIVIKGDESTYRQKFLTYEAVTISHQDETLQALIKEAKEHYSGDVEEIKVRIAIEWQ